MGRNGGRGRTSRIARQRAREVGGTGGFVGGGGGGERSILVSFFSRVFKLIHAESVLLIATRENVLELEAP